MQGNRIDSPARHCLQWLATSAEAHVSELYQQHWAVIFLDSYYNPIDFICSWRVWFRQLWSPAEGSGFASIVGTPQIVRQLRLHSHILALWQDAIDYQGFVAFQSWAQFGGWRVAPLFRWGYIICHVPPLFLFRFCIWRSSKSKSDVCHVLCEVLFMLDIAKLMLKQSLMWYHWITLVYQFNFNKMIFNIFQVSSDREKWLLSDILPCVVYSEVGNRYLENSVATAIANGWK